MIIAGFPILSEIKKYVFCWKKCLQPYGSFAIVNDIDLWKGKMALSERPEAVKINKFNNEKGREEKKKKRVRNVLYNT